MTDEIVAKKHNGFNKMCDKIPKPPTVRLVHRSYQPSEADLEEDLRIDAVLEELGKAVTRTVQVQFYKPHRRP